MADQVALDLTYIRQVGEEVRARLFPLPSRDGRQPDLRPVLLRYVLPGGDEVDVRFVPSRAYQYVGEPVVPDVRASLVDVVFADVYVGEVDLRFGSEFKTREQQWTVAWEWMPETDEPLNALLAAVAGTL